MLDCVEALSVIFIKNEKTVSMRGPIPVRDVVTYLDGIFDTEPDHTMAATVTIGGIDREVVTVSSGRVLVQLTKKLDTDGPDWAKGVADTIALALDEAVSKGSTVGGKPVVRSE